MFPVSVLDWRAVLWVQQAGSHFELSTLFWLCRDSRLLLQQFISSSRGMTNMKVWDECMRRIWRKHEVTLLEGLILSQWSQICFHSLEITTKHQIIPVVLIQDCYITHLHIQRFRHVRHWAAPSGPCCAETYFHDLPGSPTSCVLSFHNTFFFLLKAQWVKRLRVNRPGSDSLSFLYFKCVFFFSFTIMCFLPFSSDGLLMCSCLLTWIIPVKPSAFNSWSGFSLNHARS